MTNGSEIIQMVTNYDLRNKLEANLEEFKKTKHYEQIKHQLTTFADNNTGYDLEAATILALLGYVQELQHHQKQKIAFLLGFQKRVGEISPIKTLSESELLDPNLLGLIMGYARFNRFNEDQKNLAEDFDAQKILKELDDDLNQKALSLWAQLCYPTERHKDDVTTLSWAAYKGYTKTVKTLLALGTDINAETKYGETALMEAAKHGKTETAKTLLAAGANVNAQDKDGKTALMEAAKHGKTETAKTLLAAGANVNAQDKDGKTALMEAAKHGKTETAKTLLAAGANVNAQDKYGNTALMYADIYRHTEIAKIIQEALERKKSMQPMHELLSSSSLSASDNKHSTNIQECDVPNITCCGVRTNWKSAAIAAVAVGAAVGMCSLSQASSGEIDSYAIDL